ncbi:MAG TPA: ABC transporter permease subunit [Chloroflexota bacterium]|nr:ABC transporter permease subunit [Chloroflexota bacterium]
MLRIAWRLQRAGVIGMSAFGVVYGYIQAAAYGKAAGATAASRIALGHQLEAFGRTYSWILPLPVRVDTVSGYVQWRIYGALPFLFAIWALIAATGATRGDEDHGLVEVWLSSPVGPGRYIATRFQAFALAALIAVVATSATIRLTIAGLGYSLDLPAVAGDSVALLALTLVCYGLCMALAQFASRRASAVGLSGIVLAVLFFVNSLGRTDAGLRAVAAVISPFYHLDRSTPLTPGGAFDLGATIGLFAGAFVVTALAAWLMTIRDIGSPLLRRGRREHAVTHVPARNRLLRVPVLSTLYERRLGLLGWTLGASIGAAYMPTVGRSIVDLSSKGGSFAAYLAVVGGSDPYVALTGYIWFGVFQLALVALALIWVARWSADDSEGRLEMELSAPVSRRWVVAERALAFVATAVVVITVSSVVLYLAAAADHIHIHAGDLAVASVALLPFVLSFAAIGAALTSLVPRAAIAVLATIAFLSYLITEGGPLFKWPDWVMKLSVFSLYGTPLTRGIYWTGFWILLAITVAGFGAATLLMERRDVGR